MRANKHSGFTIVELLIVVVIIAILATITIVSYNGTQNRAKTDKGAAGANSLGKKVLAAHSIGGLFPSYCSLATNTLDSATANPASQTTGPGSCVAGATTTPTESTLSDTSTLSSVTSSAGAGYTAAVSNGNKVVGYWLCNASTGANVYYWDYTNGGAGSIVKKAIGTGC